MAAAAYLLGLAAVASAECVRVSGVNPDAPKFHATNGRIRVTAVQEGKALADVHVLFSLANCDVRSKDVNFKLDLTTDKHGAIFTTGLAPGLYYVQAIGPEYEFSDIYLEVRGGGGRETNSYVLKIPPTFLPEKPADVERTAITERVLGFKGRVLDPSGAFVPRALVQVYRKDKANEPIAKLRANEGGVFSAELEPGQYVVFVKEPGFVTKAVGFEVAPNSETQELRIELRIGTPCG